jgi:two-component system sensor histidine kinase HydH
MKVRDRLAALGQMAAGLAHEIRNPLGAIKGAAQLLADPMPGAAPIEPASREFVGIILEEVERLDRVVGSVLDYARPGPEAPSAVDVNAIIRRTVQIVGPSCAEGQAIDVALDESVARARIDAEKLRQVLMNLIQNGLQAMTTTGVVHVATRPRRAPPGWGDGGDRPWLEIAIRDRGPGMSKKVQKSLFVPFFTTKDGGTGLGLAISQRIVQSAGGTIDVVSLEGEGTTFSVLLPGAIDGESGDLVTSTPTPPAAEARVPAG